jgi:hypothetical protein
MERNIRCRKNCIYYEKGSCSFRKDLTSGIFASTTLPCIYYSKKNNQKVLNDNAYVQAFGEHISM